MPLRTALVLIVLLLSAVRPMTACAQRGPGPGRPVPQAAPDPNAPRSLSGRITDDKGNPVTDARLMFSPVQGGRVYQARTNENGDYQLPAVDAEGTFRLNVNSAGWLVADPSSLGTVTLKPGAAAEFNFQMQRACQVMIRLTDEQGAPVSRAQLQLMPLGGRQARAGRGGPGGSQFSSAEGFAVVGGMSPSDQEYQIEIRHDDFAPAHLVVKLTNPDETELKEVKLLAGQPVTGTAICSDGLPAAGWGIHARPSWTISGSYPPAIPIGEDGSFTIPHVVAGTYDLQLHIAAADGRSGTGIPIEADVDLLARNPLVLSVKMPSPGTMATIRGKIEYVGEPPEQSFRVESLSSDLFSHRTAFLQPGQTEFLLGPIPKVPTRIRVEGAGVEAEEVTVTPPAEGVVIKVSRIAAPKLAGIVVDDATGQPVPEFRISPIKVRTLQGPNYVESGKWREFQDAAGKFETTFNGPGIYQLVITAPGYAPLRTADLNSQERPAEPPTYRLGRGFSLRGKVVDERGAAVEDAQVTLELSGARQDTFDGPVELATVASRAGAFELSNISPGPQLIRVTHPDFAVLYVERVLARPPEEPLELALQAGGTIRGTVFNAAGAPLPAAIVEIQGGPYANMAGSYDRAVATAVSDDFGGYSFARVPAGDYRVLRSEMIQSRGVQQQVVHVENRGVHTVPLGGGAVVTGRVLLNGAPLANTQVRIADSDYFGFRAEETTDAEGRFRFFGIPPGHRHLVATLPGSRSDAVSAGAFDFLAAGNDLGDLLLETGTVTLHLDPPAAHDPARGLAIVPVTTGQSIEQRPYFAGNRGVMKPPAQPGDPYLFQYVAVGRHQIAMSLGNHAQVEQEFEITRDKRDIEFTLRLPTGTASLRGTVPEEYRNLRQRLVLGLVHPSTGFRTSAVVNADGSFEAAGLPAGDYRLHDASRRDVTLLELSLAEGESKSLALDRVTLGEPKSAPQRGVLRVRVYTIEGCQLPAHIELTDPAGTVEPVSAKNSWLTPEVPPGKYQLKVAFPGFETQTREVEAVEYQLGKQVEPQYVYLVPRW